MFAVSSDHVGTTELLCCHIVTSEIYFISYIMQCTIYMVYVTNPEPKRRDEKTKLCVSKEINIIF